VRTNIVIDDKLMADVMASVEEGLRLLKRKKVYAALLDLRGKLHWDDSDEAWARVRAEAAQPSVAQEPAPGYAVAGKPKAARKTKGVGAGEPAVQPAVRTTARAGRKST
jgi:antitoxin ParD1/3/4